MTIRADEVVVDDIIWDEPGWRVLEVKRLSVTVAITARRIGDTDGSAQWLLEHEYLVPVRRGENESEVIA